MANRESGTGEGRRHRLAVMLSGSGRTLVNLQKEIDEGRLDAKIVLVIASRECLGAERARGLGLETMVEGGVIEARRLGEMLAARNVEWVALAGYLKLVKIPPAYRGRFVNIHPALLPKFGGAGMHGHHVHEAVIKAGEKESGCTVHLCDEHFDTGDILLQKRCPVLPGDTADTLAARVFELECEAYPEALRKLFAPERLESDAAMEDPETGPGDGVWMDQGSLKRLGQQLVGKLVFVVNGTTVIEPTGTPLGDCFKVGRVLALSEDDVVTLRWDETGSEERVPLEAVFGLVAE